MKLLDLYCGAGGASEGYRRAGFEAVGVDIKRQKRYPFEFHQEDALEFVKQHGHEFDVIHASPPCQSYSATKGLSDGTHPMLIEQTRSEIIKFNIPYVIENVIGAPLLNPIMLCGGMFSNLRTYRHRLFESNVDIKQPEHIKHINKTVKMGRRPSPDEFISVVGNFSGVPEARIAMDIDWMVQSELAQAIPPAYTEYIGSIIKEFI